MPTILLDNISGIALVILRPTGVIYSNQAGGLLCNHPEAEGVLAPLNDDQRSDRLEHALGRLTRNWSGLSEDLAEQIDALLRKSVFTECLRVDRSRLNESMESWIYVTVAENVGDTPLLEFGDCHGILVWTNSD